MQLATSFFLPTFSKNHILRIQNAWFRRRPRIQAVTQQDDLPRSRDLGGGETPLKSGEFLGVFFSLNSHLPGHMEIFFDEIGGMRTFKSWGDEPEMRETVTKNHREDPTCPPHSQGGSSDLWNYTKLWFMRLQEDPTNWWWDSGYFWVFLCGSFLRSLASQVAWWSTSMRKIRPRGWTWRILLSPRYVANPMHQPYIQPISGSVFFNII